jgi:hypothetical protein
MGQPNYTGAEAPTATPEQEAAAADFLAQRNARLTPVTESTDVSPEPIPAESTVGETAEPMEGAE